MFCSVASACLLLYTLVNEKECTHYLKAAWFFAFMATLHMFFAICLYGVFVSALAQGRSWFPYAPALEMRFHWGHLEYGYAMACISMGASAFAFALLLTARPLDRFAADSVAPIMSHGA